MTIRAADVAAAFPGSMKREGNRYRGAPCPVCEGGDKDAFWAEDGDRALLVGCNQCAPSGGADFLRATLAALGLTGGDVFFGPGRAPEGTYEWTDKATGATVLQTRTASGDPKYRWPKGTRKAALVFLPRPLTGSGPLIVTEGAKAATAHALAGHDVIGLPDEGSWHKAPAAAVLKLFANRDVILWPDADEGGLALAERAAAHLARTAAAVRIIRPEHLPGAPAPMPKGWDAYDWQPPAGTNVPAALAAATEWTTAGAAKDEHPGARYLLLQDCPDVAAPVEWIWRNRIPRGRLTLLSGAPDAGKSMAAVAIAAAVSRGLALPDDDPRPAGSVVWIGGEDEDGVPMTAARLRAAGADPQRVAVLQETPANFAIGILDATGAALDYKPDLVVVDSHVSWFEESNDGQAVRKELRAAFGSLMKGGAAVKLICHWRKQSVEDGPGHFRAAGSSGGLVGAARAQLDIEKLDGPARIMRCIKHSGAPESDDVRFNIVAAGLVGRVEWEAVTPHMPGTAGGRNAQDDRVLEYLAKVAEPSPKNRICEALELNSILQRQQVSAALWRLQLAGKVTVEKAIIRGREREVYRSTGDSQRQPATTGDGCSEQPANRPAPPKGGPVAAGSSDDFDFDLGGDRQPVDPAGPQPAAAAPSEPAPDAPSEPATAGAAPLPAAWWSQYAATWTTCTICSARAACVPDDSGERYACRQCANRMQRAGAALRSAGRTSAVVNVTVAA